MGGGASREDIEAMSKFEERVNGLQDKNRELKNAYERGQIDVERYGRRIDELQEERAREFARFESELARRNVRIEELIKENTRLSQTVNSLLATNQQLMTRLDADRETFKEYMEKQRQDKEEDKRNYLGLVEKMQEESRRERQEQREFQLQQQQQMMQLLMASMGGGGQGLRAPQQETPPTYAYSSRLGP